MSAPPADRSVRASEPRAPGQVRHANDWNSFGEALYSLRVRRGLKQIVVARGAKLSRGYYSGIENSKRRPPPLPTVRLIGRALGLDEPDLSELEVLADLDRDEAGEHQQLPRSIRTILCRLRSVGSALPPAVVDSIAAQLNGVSRSAATDGPARAFVTGQRNGRRVIGGSRETRSEAESEPQEEEHQMNSS